jgi:hypothetical protein
VPDDFAKLPGPSPAAQALKHELSTIILWNERNAPRSKQQAIGPSELGDPCDRKLAYRIAGAAPVNRGSDPWPAIVGTSIHNWLEEAVNKYQRTVEDLGYLTELRVQPDELVRGRSDLFHVPTGCVVDHKTSGIDGMRKAKKGNVSEGYRIQVHLYGLGHKRAGRDVRHVALVFYPRSGWLGDVQVWTEPYDEQVALDALARLYRIGRQLMDLEIESNPHRYGLIEATPGDSCVWCPFFLAEKNPEIAADLTGCPGR